MAFRIIIGLLLSSSLSYATVFNTKKLQSDLKTKKTTWVAKENHLSQLSVEELKRMMGYKRPAGLNIEFSSPEMSLMNNKASLMDWRNQNGQNWVSPMLDQGNCGSCVAFATVATLETQMNISRQLPWLNPKYSTQALFACGGGGCDRGWYPASAANYVKTRGVPDEACAPYTMGANGLDVSCSSICANSASRSQKATNYRSYANSAQVKLALAKGPVVTTMMVYMDFVLYHSGVYKHAAGEMLGGHAVSIIGYNDVERYWIIRNSWSQSWGENGYAMVSYDDDSGIGDEGWSFDVAPASGVVAIENLSDRDYLAGTAKIKGYSSYGASYVQNLTITGQGKTATYSCTGTECVFDVDTTTFPDGRYETTLQSSASVGGTAVAESERKYFYVLNHEPTGLGLTFKGKAVDLTKPVSGRIEFDVTTASSPVPMTELEFIVSQNGHVVMSRANRNILPTMSIGWRTINVPNGQYDITLVGRVIVGDKVYTQNSQTYSVNVKN